MLDAFAQTVCGEGTHSVTKDGILTCVLDDPQPTGSFSGISPNLDFSNPDAIQNSMFETLLPNLINADKLGNVAEASPIVYDILVYLTSLAGIIPIMAGGLLGIAFLIKKMKKDKMQNKAESGVLQYLCMKCDTEMKQEDYMEHGGLCAKHRTKKQFKLHMPKMNMPKMNMNLKKKSKDEPSQSETSDEYLEYLEQEIKSQERDLEVITDPKEAVEVMEDIEDMVKEKEELFDSPEEALINSLDPAPTEVKDPEEMSLEELEEQINEKGHKVEVSDDKLEITQKPEIVEVKPKTELEAVKEHVEESANKMEDEFDEALDQHDFEPSEEEIKEAQEKFENEIESNADVEPEQESPNEEDILEVQRLMKDEGMTQDEAIQKVISGKVAEEPKPSVVEFIENTDDKTLEEKHEAQDIEEMEDERDIFKLDVPKKKQSPLQKKLAQTSFGKKMFKNTDRKQKEKEREKETRMVLNDLGEQRMLEYAKKIDDKLQHWADDQLHHEYEHKEKTTGEKNLSPTEISQELKKLALFASMCEMMAGKKTSKKRYWKRTSKYETETA